MDNRKSLEGLELACPWLEIRDLYRLGRTCRFFKMHLPIARAAYYVVVEPSEIEIKKILDAARPELLKKLLTTKIPRVAAQSSRTIINSTLLQLAFGEGDNEMCYMLKIYFEKVFGFEIARKMIHRQLNEKFSEGSEEEKQQTEAEDLKLKNNFAALLNTVILAITNERFDRGKSAQKLILNPATLAAIAAFREAFDALQPKTINKGMHFRLNTLQETYNRFVQAAVHWGNDYKRYALFEDGVLSSVLRYVPGNDAERFSQGLYFLHHKERFERRSALRGSTTNFYDHLRLSSPNFFALVGYSVDIYYGEKRYTTTSRVDHGESPPWPPLLLPNLITNKNSKLAELRQLYPRPPSRCVIC